MISNSELAKQFELFAEIHELKDPNDRFRIIAYQRASQVIKSYGESLQSVYEQKGLKGLKEINGIGEAISKKIEEYIKTGKIKELEKLKKGFPKGEIEFMEIPGVGPKTSQKLSNELGAKNIEDLKKKLEKRGAKFFKEKTLANIKRGIEVKGRLGGRMLLAYARPFVEEIVDFIRQDPEVKNVEAVGSYRRWRETVGDIDIIASAENAVKVISHFTKFADFYKVINQGSTKSTAIHKSGIQVDLEILPEDEFGSLLQHFTGSKEHNVALRTYAQTKGLSVSEHGVKNVKTGKLVKCAKEVDVYKTLKMDWIEPELREDRGEIKAALNHSLPKIISLGDIKGDLHVHTKWSDGQNSVDEVVKFAIDLKYDYVAISDHTVGLGVARGLDEKRFLDRFEEIKKVQKKYKNIKILNSCEVNIKPDGSVDLPEKLMRSFDIVTASVHWSFSQSKQDMTKRIITAIENPNIDIIGHPTGRIINEREEYQVDWEKVFAACKKHNTALEINAYPERLDLTDSLVFKARQMGVKFAISTDAHAVRHLNNMVYGVSVARRGWGEKGDIINTLSLSGLERFLKEN